MLADILPTGYEVGVLNGRVRPGDVVAVVGAGPIGLAAIMGARLFSPSHIVAIDLADSRLEAAKQFGADIVVNNGREDPAGDRRRRSPTGSAPTSRSRPSVSRPRSSWPRARPARRPRRQHRRARRAGDAAPRGPVDPGRDDHDRARRHVLDADAAAAADRPPARRQPRSSPTTSARRVRRRPTTCSLGPPRPARSRSCSTGSDCAPLGRRHTFGLDTTADQTRHAVGRVVRRGIVAHRQHRPAVVAVRRGAGR